MIILQNFITHNMFLQPFPLFYSSNVKLLNKSLQTWPSLVEITDIKSAELKIMSSKCVIINLKWHEASARERPSSAARAAAGAQAHY